MGWIRPVASTLGTSLLGAGIGALSSKDRGRGALIGALGGLGLGTGALAAGGGRLMSLAGEFSRATPQVRQALRSVLKTPEMRHALWGHALDAAMGGTAGLGLGIGAGKLLAPSRSAQQS